MLAREQAKRAASPKPAAAKSPPGFQRKANNNNSSLSPPSSPSLRLNEAATVLLHGTVQQSCQQLRGGKLTAAEAAVLLERAAAAVELLRETEGASQIAKLQAQLSAQKGFTAAAHERIAQRPSGGQHPSVPAPVPGVLPAAGVTAQMKQRQWEAPER